MLSQALICASVGVSIITRLLLFLCCLWTFVVVGLIGCGETARPAGQTGEVPAPAPAAPLPVAVAGMGGAIPPTDSAMPAATPPAPAAPACVGESCDDPGTVQEPSPTATELGMAPAVLPTPTQACPNLGGNGNITVLGRSATIWSGGALQQGPLIFYWHGTGQRPSEASLTLGSIISSAVAQGGLVVSFSSAGGSGDTTANDVWYFEDFAVADEIVGCAVEQSLIDPARIHATGYSAGGIQAATMIYERDYLASVITYSGGLSGYLYGSARTLGPSNTTAGMLIHGGASDGSFQDLSMELQSLLTAEGQFALTCNHNGGHLGNRSQYADSGWQFLDTHRYNTLPSPWTAGLPAGFHNTCSL